jgi:hypothetical protein
MISENLVNQLLLFQIKTVFGASYFYPHNHVDARLPLNLWAVFQVEFKFLQNVIVGSCHHPIINMDPDSAFFF